MIPKEVLDADMYYFNLLTNHGEVNIDMIKKIEEIYIGTESIVSQYKSILYHCLMNSL